ncbi:transcriptional repressor NrdR [Roseimicrobium gellanilyticum]|uniref:Transcriptional repressor NrdR n=1 Tax=Roseimicrobium gellanilyticum TaxID=748857 RepID=A0A366HPG7_9BACT|nr:transcriptional regulator NrdR [Roseimicrobium gellanilyticum]RBP44350.1 transcriptional repressor NrdR [Roseimicrobium gellanilyticum]
MRCPKCGTPEDKVIDSREAKDGASIRRRRECLTCGHRFTTYEQVEYEDLTVVKRDQKREPWSREKLIDSMKKACGKRPVSVDTLETAADAILTEVESAGQREVPSRTIGAKVMQYLEKIDHVAYVRYASIYREFQDVTDFISEVNSLGTRVPRDAAKQPELFKKLS